MSRFLRRARRLATSLTLVGLLALPAAAAAQTTTGQSPNGGPTLSSQPPVRLGSKSRASSRTPPKASSRAGASAPVRLPNTGYDVVEVGLLGLVLVLLGIGLRLRTRDVRWA